MTEQLTETFLRAEFRARFGGSARLFRSPARVNIIGEHTDYNDGLVMPTNTALYTWLAFAPRDDRRVLMYASRFNELVEVSLDDLRATPNGGWQEYPKGVLHVLRKRGFDMPGADILIAGDIPLGSGLSSSASLETAIAFAMLSCAEDTIDRRQLAVMCREAENDFVGVSCGIMDQYVVALCERDDAMLLDCRSLDYELVPLSAGGRFVIVHSGVTHRHREGGYNSRKEECRQAAALLAGRLPQVLALRDVRPAEIEAERERLGDCLYRRARHVVTEIDRVRRARQALADDDLGLLGSLMTASHTSLRDDFEVSCGAVDELIEMTLACDSVYGSRMVGGGFGGCIVSLVDGKRVDSYIEEVCRWFRKRHGTDPWHHALAACDPVQEVIPE
jgi:galactokinase